MSFRSLRWSLLLILPLAFLACRRPAPESDSGALRVVATFSVLGEFVRQVGGDEVDLVTLVEAGGDVHTFEPAPTHSIALLEADLVFEMGLDLESWLDPLYRSSGSRAERIAVSEGLPTLPGPHGEVDPHVWLDASLASAIVAQIEEALCRRAPQSAEGLRARATAYRQKLADLDRWIAAEVARLPADRRKLITSHDFLAYYARRYGFQSVGSVLASSSTEAADPSAADLAALARLIRAAGVPALFPEADHSPRILERLAVEAGVRLAPPLLGGGLAAPGRPGDSYLEMMRANTKTLVEALSQ